MLIFGKYLHWKQTQNLSTFLAYFRINVNYFSEKKQNAFCMQNGAHTHTHTHVLFFLLMIWFVSVSIVNHFSPFPLSLVGLLIEILFLIALRTSLNHFKFIDNWRRIDDFVLLTHTPVRQLGLLLVVYLSLCLASFFYQLISFFGTWKEW